MKVIIRMCNTSLLFHECSSIVVGHKFFPHQIRNNERGRSRDSSIAMYKHTSNFPSLLNLLEYAVKHITNFLAFVI